MNHHSKASEVARDQAKWEWYTSPPYEDEDAPLGLDDSEEVIRIIQPDFSTHDSSMVAEILETYSDSQRCLKSQVHHLRKYLRRVSLENASLRDMIQMQNMEKLVEIEEPSPGSVEKHAVTIQSASCSRLDTDTEPALPVDSDYIIPVKSRSLQGQPHKKGQPCEKFHLGIDVSGTSESDLESDEEFDDITVHENDDDESDDTSSPLDTMLMHKRRSLFHSTDTQPEEASRNEQSRSLLSRIFAHLTNVSIVRNAVSIAFVNITGYTLKELFKTNTKKPEKTSPSFSVGLMKRSVKRFQRRVKPPLKFLGYMGALLNWKNEEFTLMVFLVYMLAVITGWFVQLIIFVCILKLYVNYIITHRHPVYFSFLPDMRSGAPNEEKLPFSDLKITNKFGMLLQIAKKSQITLSDCADTLEKIHNLFMWKVPELTFFLVKALVLTFILSVILSGTQFLKLIGLYVGFKLFIMRRIYRKYPNFKYATSTIYKVWIALPTDAEFYEQMSLGRRLWKGKKRFNEKKKMISQGIKKLRKRSMNSLTSKKNLQSKKLPFEHEFDNKAISKLMETKDLEMEIKDSKTDTNHSKIDSKKITHTKQLAVTPTTSAEQITRKKKLSSGSPTTVQVIVTNEDMLAKTVGTSKPDTSKAKTVGTSQPDTSKAKAFGTSQPDTSKAKAVGTSQPDTSKAKAVGTSQPVTAMDDGKKKKSFGMGIFKRAKKTESFSFTEGTELEVSRNVAVELQSSNTAVQKKVGTKQPNKTASEVDKDSANGTAISVSASSISSIYTSVKAVTSEGFSYSPFSGLGSGKLVTSYDSRASSSAVVSPDVSSGQVSYLGSAGSYVRVASIGQALGDHFNSLAGTFFTKRATLIVSNQQNIEITLPNEEHPLTEAPLGWTCVLEENVNVMTTFQPGILYISLSSLCFKPTDIASSQWIIIDLSKITQVVKSKKARWIPGRNMSDHIQITVEGVNKPYIFGSVSSFDECYKVIMVHGKAHNYEWAEEFREIPHVFLNNIEYHFSLAGLYQSIRN